MKKKSEIKIYELISRYVIDTIYSAFHAERNKTKKEKEI